MGTDQSPGPAFQSMASSGVGPVKLGDLVCFGGWDPGKEYSTACI